MPEVRFETPANLQDLARCLAGAKEGARLLGGGTDLLLRLRELRRQGVTLVDTTGVAGLDGLEAAGGILRIGANVTYARIAGDPFIRERIPCLAAMAAQVGSPQIRNMARLPGNLANASPGGDAIGVLLALDAQVQAMDGTGRIRSLSVDELVTGVGRTSLAKDEAILEIRMVIPEGPWNGYGKIGLTPRREVVIANVGLTMVFRVEDGALRDARIVLASTSPRAHRCPEAEALCLGRVPSADLARALAEALRCDVASTIGDNPAFQHKLNDVQALALDVFGGIFRES
jgi:carbon-monoxide dehydrogenase medium subunit